MAGFDHSSNAGAARNHMLRGETLSYKQNIQFLSLTSYINDLAEKKQTNSILEEIENIKSINPSRPSSAYSMKSKAILFEINSQKSKSENNEDNVLPIDSNQNLETVSAFLQTNPDSKVKYCCCLKKKIKKKIEREEYKMTNDIRMKWLVILRKILLVTRFISALMKVKRDVMGRCNSESIKQIF